MTAVALPQPRATPPEAPGCNLCGELAAGGPPLHREMIPGSPASRILDESRHFVAVPSIGPLTAGHLLVMPRRHVLGILRLPGEEIRECEDLIAGCADRLWKLYGRSVILFEHGSAPNGTRSGTCIEHAHLHLVPGPAPFVSHVAQATGRWERAKVLSGLAAGDVAQEYLLIGTVKPEPSFFVNRGSRSVPSQFLRQQYAAFTGGNTAWDWRVEPREELFLRTLSDWKNAGRDAAPAQF